MRDGAGQDGRLTKLTPTVRREAIKLARLGLPYKIIAQACGVVDSTFYLWMKRGREKGASEAMRSFAEAIDKARAEAVVRHAAIVQSAGRKNWQASAWFLERTHPDEFGRRDRLGLDPPKDGKGSFIPGKAVFELEWGEAAPGERRRDSDEDDDA